MNEVGITKEAGFKHRVIEVLLTIIFSAVTTAITVSWSLSALITQARLRLDRIELRQDHVESLLATTEQIDANQQTELALSESADKDQLRRLESIETKIDRLGDRK